MPYKQIFSHWFAGIEQSGAKRIQETITSYSLATHHYDPRNLISSVDYIPNEPKDEPDIDRNTTDDNSDLSVDDSSGLQFPRPLHDAPCMSKASVVATYVGQGHGPVLMACLGSIGLGRDSGERGGGREEPRRIYKSIVILLN